MLTQTKTINPVPAKVHYVIYDGLLNEVDRLTNPEFWLERMMQNPGFAFVNLEYYVHGSGNHLETQVDKKRFLDSLAHARKLNLYFFYYEVGKKEVGDPYTFFIKTEWK